MPLRKPNRLLRQRLLPKPQQHLRQPQHPQANKLGPGPNRWPEPSVTGWLTCQGGELARVSQTRRNAIDRQMDAALRPLISNACAVASYQLHLQMVQRVDVGESVFDRARQ